MYWTKGSPAKPACKHPFERMDISISKQSPDSALIEKSGEVKKWILNGYSLRKAIEKAGSGISNETARTAMKKYHNFDYAVYLDERDAKAGRKVRHCRGM